MSGLNGKDRLSSVTRVFADRAGFCALVGDDKLVCWGDNVNGQLGDGTEVDSAIPVEVQLSLDR